jgi:hypothetical protein
VVVGGLWLCVISALLLHEQTIEVLVILVAEGTAYCGIQHALCHDPALPLLTCEVHTVLPTYCTSVHLFGLIFIVIDRECREQLMKLIL